MFNKKAVFIIGARGYTIPYGGWETFVRGLIDNWSNSNYHFYVFEKVETKLEIGLKNISPNLSLIKIYAGKLNNSVMMRYDLLATNYAIKFSKYNKFSKPIFYYLGVRIGPYVYMMKNKIKLIKGVIIVNVAGLEWKRTKWNFFVQIYLFVSAYLMVIASDFIVCDSEAILEIYNKLIKSKKIIKLFIPYGTYVKDIKNNSSNKSFLKFIKKHSLSEYNYYLIISRFVPENKFEIIISEFLKSTTQSNLVIISNFKKEIKYYEKLEKKYHFTNDPRIKLIDSLYDKNLLDVLRLRSKGYINGHSLGGTNPGLLEALSYSDVVIAYDVIFSRQVCLDNAIYFNSDKNSLLNAIKKCDSLELNDRKSIAKKSKIRMKQYYSWDKVCSDYEKLFNNILGV